MHATVQTSYPSMAYPTCNTYHACMYYIAHMHSLLYPTCTYYQLYFMYLGPISRMLGLVGQPKNMIIIVIVLHLPAALPATQSSYSLNFSINLDAFCCNTGMHRRIWTATMVTARGKILGSLGLRNKIALKWPYYHNGLSEIPAVF